MSRNSPAAVTAVNYPARGFTLIEIAVVLVIIGLLLGGVLKGQELITASRVRNLIAQQDGIKAAFFGFQDRYRALPGDYKDAAANLNCTGGCPAGNGDGKIVDTSPREHIFVWTHLSAAGFLKGSYSATSSTSTLQPGNTPTNPYVTYLRLAYDQDYGSSLNPQTSRHNLKTGNQVPVEILAEVDRKIDDGNAYGGNFQFSDFAGDGSTNPDEFSCVDFSTGYWAISNGTTDCGATTLL
jgi:prepilin-type N-terminal cleavage/methylation domain-containing protein